MKFKESVQFYQFNDSRKHFAKEDEQVEAVVEEPAAIEKVVEETIEVVVVEEPAAIKNVVEKSIEVVVDEPAAIEVVVVEETSKIHFCFINNYHFSNINYLEAPEAGAAAEGSEVKKQDVEKFLPEIPNHAQYLIVGGGTAAMAAFKAIRANDENARVLVVTEENFKPYMRPPLSKDLWMTDDEKLVSELKFKQYNGNERRFAFY